MEIGGRFDDFSSASTGDCGRKLDAVDAEVVVVVVVVVEDAADGAVDVVVVEGDVVVVVVVVGGGAVVVVVVVVVVGIIIAGVKISWRKKIQGPELIMIKSLFCLCVLASL